MSDAVAHDLITTDDVIAAMGLDPTFMEEAIPAFESAIARAKLKLQTVLGTKFTPLSCTDTFVVTPIARSLNYRYTLRLTNGLLRAPPTVAWCSEIDGTYEALALPISDLLRGIVQIPGSDPRQEWYVKVNYTSGYKKGDRVPTGLHQGLICLVPMLLLSTSAATAESKQYKVEHAKALSLEGFSEDMVQDYTRRAGACIRPLDHTSTPLQVV